MGAMFEQQQWTWDDFATTDATSGYLIPIILPEGSLVEILEFGVNAKTTYAAADTNYQTFTLCNAAGSTIAAVANGPSSGGLAIGPAVVTGVNEAPTAATKVIDCSSGPVAVYVKTSATGNGRAMVGISGWIKYRRKRA